jgi:outer membrane protein OmpA-like peptidoglycan-associated protein
VRRLAVLLLACLPAACAEGSPQDPVAWWHHLEGGAIAQQRPPPPNADAPYPKLVTVPARPQVLAPAERSRIASALTKDRANAEYAAARAPIVPPAPVRATAAPAADPNASNAVMQAADAPPAPPPKAPAARAPAARAQAGAAVAAAAVPAMPLQPPPPPVLPGVPSFTRPSPAAVAPPPGPARTVFAPGKPVTIAFAANSAALPPGTETALGQLARTRGTAPMRVVGFGNASGDDPASQAAALPLAYARAESIANALARAGVPLASIRLIAEAQGHGGVAAVAD